LLSVGAFKVFYLKEAATVSRGAKVRAAPVMARSLDRLDRRPRLHAPDRSKHAYFVDIRPAPPWKRQGVDTHALNQGRVYAALWIVGEHRQDRRRRLAAYPPDANFWQLTLFIGRKEV